MAYKLERLGFWCLRDISTVMPSREWTSECGWVGLRGPPHLVVLTSWRRHRLGMLCNVTLLHVSRISSTYWAFKGREILQSCSIGAPLALSDILSLHDSVRRLRPVRWSLCLDDFLDVTVGGCQVALRVHELACRLQMLVLANIDHVLRLLLSTHEHYRRVCANKLVYLRVLLVCTRALLCLILSLDPRPSAALGPCDLATHLSITLQWVSLVYQVPVDSFCAQDKVAWRLEDPFVPLLELYLVLVGLQFLTIHELVSDVLDARLSLKRGLCLLVEIFALLIVAMSLSVHSCPATDNFCCNLFIDRPSNLLEDAVFVLLYCQVASLIVNCFFASALLRRPWLTQAFFLAKRFIWDRMIASRGKVVSVGPEWRLAFSREHLRALLS